MKKTMKLFGMAALIMVASTVANAEKKDKDNNKKEGED